MAVSFTPEDATVDFANGSRLAMRASDAILVVTLSVPDDQDMARMRQVVAEHLDRFAFREAPLRFDWQDA